MSKLNKFLSADLPEGFEVHLVNIADIPRQFAERKPGRWYGWKNRLLQQADGELGEEDAIQIETPSHCSALALRKDMGTIASRISKNLQITVRGSKVYILRSKSRDQNTASNLGDVKRPV